MKRKLLLLSAMIVTALSASAQMEWHVQNSGFPAASRGINGFSVVDSNVVWATAYDGTQTAATIRDYTMTTDGGATWLAGTVAATGLNANFGLANISAIDADTAYAAIYPITATAAPQGVYKTTNGGANWTKVSTGKFVASSSFINVVHFFNAKDGVALGDPAGGYFEVYTTSDYGVTWTRVSQANIPYVPQANEYGTVGYYGANDSTILYSTNFGNILVSKDRGLTWSTSTTPLNVNGTYIPKLEFKDKNTVLGVMGNAAQAVNSLIISIDGGTTWAYAGIDTASDVFDFNDIAYVPGTPNTWFVTSANFNSGGLGSAYTEDGGTTWISVDKIQHTSVQFNDINNGWSGGFNTSATEGGIFKWGSVRMPASVSFGKVDAFKVYPNPSNDLVYVSANVNGASTIKVIDMMGRVVFEKSYPTKSLLLTSFDVSNYASGLYFVEVSESNNKSVQKVVVK
jgi:photosystem II stability/assembly factor-like uncharacterized protein